MPQADVRDPVRQSYAQLAAEYDTRWAFYINASLELVLGGLKLGGNELVLDTAAVLGTGRRSW